MKSSLLIQALQQLDPTGEIDVCIMNGDIWSINKEHAYYDGSLFKVEFDATGRPVTGMRIRTGFKINIHPIYIEDAMECETFTMQYVSEEDRERYQKRDLERKLEENEMTLELQKGHFVDWVFKQAQDIRPVPLDKVEKIVNTAEKFYDENKLGPDSPKLVCKPGKTTRQTEEDFWDEHIVLEWDDYSRFSLSFVTHPMAVAMNGRV